MATLAHQTNNVGSECKKFEFIKGTSDNDKWILIRNFASIHEQLQYLKSYDKSMQQCDDKFLSDSPKSFRMNYIASLPFEQQLMHKLKLFVSQISDYKLPFTKCDGVALLYGLNASMSAHTDSLSRPQVTNEEWTCTINIGCDICFQLNHKQVIAHSGDVLIMDSRAVLHGVDKIIPNTCPADIPLKNARFGVIFWESAF